MAGVISIGGLATGLDTNKIIDQLVALERRPIDLLSDQVASTQNTKSSIGRLSGKITALKTAADALNSLAEVLVRKASSSATTVATATAGSGAQKGTATLEVTRLARGSVAGAVNGKTAATDTVALGDGTFRFQVGTGDVQTVDVTATTTLQDLATAITGTDAGVSATVVNFGTAAAPDYRLQLTSTETGDSSTISIVHDDTTLAVQTTQGGLNAQFTVSGFTTTFERESNTFDDVLEGVTIALKAEGTTTITVDDDAEAIVAKVRSLVTAYNDIRTFVAGESTVETGVNQDELALGSLAGNSTVRNVVSRLQDALTGALEHATTQYVNVASLGLATQRDGTILFNEATFRDALASAPTAVAQVFAGNGTDAGVASALVTLTTELTGTAGALTKQTSSLDDQIKSLQDQIDAGERNIESFEVGLRLQFAALEQLVASLQSQGSFLAQAFSQL
jgi:flagellar hook-associated protein 2